MLYATDDDGRKISASPRTLATCPECRAAVRSKCGTVVTWHWAHLARPTVACQHEPETEWHRAWKSMVPPERCEVVMQRNGERHRADIVTHEGMVVELQHSSISEQEIQAREAFYGSMAWIFDARGPTEAERLTFPSRYGNGRCSFRWKHARTTLRACRAPIMLDTGRDFLLLVRRLYMDDAPAGWGEFVSRASVVNMLGPAINWKIAAVASPGEVVVFSVAAP